MLCQRCNQKNANVHITQIVNGQKHETHLCQNCAHQMQLSMGVPEIPLQGIPNLFGFLNKPESGSDPGREYCCPECGTSYGRIGESGLVGCSECYKHFSTRLDPVLRKIHGSSRHCGKIPKSKRGLFAVKREIEDLKKKLKSEVEKEQYEAAALIRDEIKLLEEKASRGGTQ